MEVTMTSAGLSVPLLSGDGANVIAIFLTFHTLLLNNLEKGEKGAKKTLLFIFNAHKQNIIVKEFSSPLALPCAH